MNDTEWTKEEREAVLSPFMPEICRNIEKRLSEAGCTYGIYGPDYEFIPLGKAIPHVDWSVSENSKNSENSGRELRELNIEYDFEVNLTEQDKAAIKELFSRVPNNWLKFHGFSMRRRHKQ